MAAADPHAGVKALRRDRLLAQAREGIVLLEARPTDPVGRGLLGEAAELVDDPPDWVTEARDRLLVPKAPSLPLRTERLLLRRVRPEDADDMHAYYGREDVSLHLLTRPLSRAEMDAEIDRRQRLNAEAEAPPAALGLVVEHEGRVVGDVVLIFKPPDYSTAEIGWVLNPDVGGRGLATEAARALLDLGFDHYGFHRIHADLDARNTASARMCERLGMTREALFRRDYWSKGEWTDTLRYAVLADEHAQASGRDPSGGTGPGH